jgi:hypothetical protein
LEPILKSWQIADTGCGLAGGVERFRPRVQQRVY